MLTRDEFDALLKDRGTLVIDGALATELEYRGQDLNHALWSAKVLKEQSDSIRKVHLDYFLAGADIATTASYQASTYGLRDHFGMSEDESMELLKKSVRLAQLARREAYAHGVSEQRGLLVAGSVGPYGAYLANGSEYRGDYHRTNDEFQSFHRPRIQALIEAGVDLLAIETMPKLGEIEAILELLRDEFPNAITWVSCTMKNSRHISDGTPVKELLRVIDLHEHQIVAVGVNCIPTGMVFEALQYFEMYTQLPLLCYPNSGETWDATTKSWSGAQPEGRSLDRQIQVWQTVGKAKLIGGCCRTGPDYIKAVARATTRESVT